MFALGLRYLNGWAMASADGARKERAEWPPHPDRVFMALAAAWFETGQAADEGAALRWLEGLPAPGITASEATFRAGTGGGKPVVSYVPVNDTERGRKIPDSADLDKLKEAGLALLPEYRSRQPRAFPVAIPVDPDVYLCWDSEALPEPHRAPLLSLCRKVVSVGHSASFVQMWLADTPPAARWVPVEGIGAHRLRVPSPGRLNDLERRCDRANVVAWGELEARIDAAAKPKEKKMLKEQLNRQFPQGRPVSLRPVPGLWKGYERAEASELPTSQDHRVFDPRLVVLALSGQRLSLHGTLKLTEALRGAMLAACPEPIPEWVSGHAADGRATTLPHVALLPLPFVGHEHADGRLMGVALALPRAVDPAEVARVLEPWLRNADGLPKVLELFDGAALSCRAELEARESPPLSLRVQPWTRASKRWASVTPVVLDRYCNGKDKWEQAAEVVKDACERIGLPRPVDVLLHQDSMVRGAPRASQFRCLARKSDGARLHHLHALLLFGEEVEGPVLIGAGRFRGYGLCRPVLQGGESHG